MDRNNPPLYILIYFGAMCCFATGGVFVRYSSFASCTIAFYRQMLACLILLPFTWREMRSLPKRDFLIMLLGGVLIGSNLFMWNFALLHTSQANTNLLGNLHIFATVPLSFLIFKEKIQRPFVFGVLISLVGLFILVTGKADPAAGSFMGDFMAFLSSLLYGGYMITTYSVRDHMSAWCAVEIGTLSGMVILLPLMLLTEGWHFPSSWADIWPLLLIVLFGQFGGIGLMSVALGRIQASLGSVLSLTQCAIGALLGFILFSEHLSWQEIIGMVIVSLGVYLAQKKKTDPIDSSASSPLRAS